MLSKLNLRSEFIKYTMVLMTGTALAQLITFAFAPVITRLYTPEESAELGIFFRIIALGGALATLRYEVALPLPKRDSHAFLLYKIAMYAILLVTSLSFLFVLIPFYFANDTYSQIFYLLLPIGIGLVALQNSGTYWSIRNKRFSLISYTKTTSALFTSGFKVVLGWVGFGYMGLILGTVFGLIASQFWYLKDYLLSNKKFKQPVRSKRTQVLVREYREFPLINLPHVLMDLTRDLIVAALILQLFAKDDFGLYDHAYRMLQLPLALVGLTLGQVFFQKIAALQNEGNAVKPLMIRSVRTLFLLSLLPFAIIFFFGDDLFAFVFGEEWREAGTYSSILAPWFITRFVSSPVSSVPIVMKKQRAFFFLSLIAAILMIGALAVPQFLFDSNIITTLWVLSISQALFQVFIIAKLIGFSGNQSLLET